MQTMKMLTGGLAGLLLAACAGNKTVMGERSFVERIPAGDPPRWLGDAAPDFGDGKLYFYGMADAREDMQLCVREAQAGAEKNLAGMLLKRIHGQLDQAMQGENKSGALGAWVGDYFRHRTENVQVSGARIAKQSVEVKKEKTASGVRYAYDCHVLVSLSQADYEDARQGVLDKLRGNAKAELNRDARETFERVMETLERGSAPDASSGR